jgi:anaerobic selenocysteine-containing dehydrogenase
MKTTACPMDCFDACEVRYDNGICKPSTTHNITRGSLCKPFVYLTQEKNLKDKNLFITLNIVKEVLKQKDKKILYYKGSGHMGVLQSVPKIFFERIKATIAQGSLCDNAGDAGIAWGRKYNINPPIKELLNSDVIIVWGRNLTVTSRHLYKLIKDKTFITIDPHKTKIAKLSKEYLCIPPKGDYSLIQQLTNELNSNSLDLDILKKLNVSKKQIKNIILLLKNKKVSFLLGLGFQKYKQGGQITHEIEKFASNFGIFDGINKGIWYLANAKYPYEDKISVSASNTDIYPKIDFGSYDIVFIQGANPAISAPNTKKVVEGLKKSFVIYFGTTNNDTAKYANIILPAKTFLQKDDVRLCYGHDEIIYCDVCENTSNAISEYDFTKFMFDSFGFNGLLTKEEYLKPYYCKPIKKPKANFIAHDTDDIKLYVLKENEYYLLTSKYVDTINSQFKFDNNVYINPINGYKNDDLIIINSQYGQIKAKVKNDVNVHKQSLLFYAGHKDVNYLTPDEPSDMGDNAIFQEVVLKIVK